MKLYLLTYRLRLHDSNKEKNYETKILKNFRAMNLYRITENSAFVNITPTDLEVAMNCFMSYLTKDCHDIHNENYIEIYYFAIPIDTEKKIINNFDPTINTKSVPTWNVIEDAVENIISLESQKEQN